MADNDFLRRVAHDPVTYGSTLDQLVKTIADALPPDIPRSEACRLTKSFFTGMAKAYIAGCITAADEHEFAAAALLAGSLAKVWTKAEEDAETDPWPHVWIQESPHIMAWYRVSMPDAAAMIWLDGQGWRPVGPGITVAHLNSHPDIRRVRPIDVPEELRA